MSFLHKESPNLVQAIVSAFFSGYDIHWPLQGTVESVEDSTLSVRVGEEIIEDVVWHFPGTPRVGSKVMVLYHKNIESRAIAMGFSSFDAFDATVAETIHLVVTKDGLSFGKEDTWEFAILGEKLKKWLEGLIDELTDSTSLVASPGSGGDGAINLALKEKLNAKKKELADILSKTVKHS